jgi:hypothetical protein
MFQDASSMQKNSFFFPAVLGFRFGIADSIAGSAFLE